MPILKKKKRKKKKKKKPENPAENRKNILKEYRFYSVSQA